MTDSRSSQTGAQQGGDSAGKLTFRILLVAVLYYLAGQASFSLAVSHGIVTLVVFLAEGVALTAAILWGRRIWPGIFIGQLLLALVNGLAWPLALGVSAINSLEAVIGATLFRRLGIRKKLDRLRDVGLLLALIFLILQPYSATCGTWLLWAGGVIPDGSLPGAWFSWWIGNSLGQAIVAPMVMSLVALGVGRSTAMRHLIAPVMLAFGIAGVVFFGPQFDGISIALALSYPLMVLLAARYGMAGSTMATVVIAALTLYGTRIGLGPFAGRDNASLFQLNLFLLGIALIGQFVAALFAERKQVEAKINCARERLDEAQRIASLGSWTLDLRSNLLEWSDEIFRIFEIDPKRFSASYESFLNAIHPEDRQRVDQAYARSVEQHTPYEVTHRLQFPDGRIKHVRERCETLYADDGTPLRSQGTVLDITSIELAEERFHLFARIFDQSSEAFVVSDPANNIVAVNPAFTELTGYSIEDVIGRNPRMLASGKTPPETYLALWKALNDYGLWRGELWDRRKDGTVYPKWSSISVIRDSAGKVSNYIASFIDIGERKAAEERIQHLAHHDTLTGLFNRFSLRQRLEQALLTAQREHGQLAVMFLDLDRFKSINDTFGHHVGDLLLVAVANRLRIDVRACDIIARLGGDEFVVVLTGLGGDAAIESVAEKISLRLAQPYQIEHTTLHSSSSIGISVFPEHGIDVNTLMRHADVAMYNAKEAGRSQFKLFNPAMITSAEQSGTSH